MQTKDKTATFAILQLARTENVIQTLQATMELKCSHPEIQLILICRQRYAQPIEFKLKEVFDDIIYIDLAQIITSKKELTLKEIEDTTRQFIKRINSFSIDVAINLSFSRSSGYLMSLIDSTHHLGLVLNNRNEMALKDNWSQFVYSNTMSGPYGAFNLVDIFKKILGTTHNSYAQKRRKLKRVKILVHPFAPHKKQAWPPGKWTEVIYHILKKHPHSRIIIIGEEKDKGNATTISSNPILENFSDRLSNTVGEKNIREIYNEFRDASLFIGHDSISSHLASIYNVQTLTLSLGMTQPHETTPYGHHNYSIASRINCFPCLPDDKCDTLPCQQDISHNVVATIVDSLIESQKLCLRSLKEKIPAIFLNKIDIYQTAIEDNAEMIFVNCLHSEGTLIDIFRSFYRVLWSFVLADREITLPFPEISVQKFHILQKYHSGLNHIIELNKFGRAYSRYIIEETESKTPNIADIKKYSDRLLEVAQFAIRLKEVYPHFSPLIDYYHILNSNASGQTIKDIAESSFVIYHESLGASEALQQLIAATLDNSGHSEATHSESRP